MKYPYALLAGLLGALVLALPAVAGEKKVVGWIEKVLISPGNFIVHAKLDSGAEYSSLDAANLHQGAIGVGIDLASGATLKGVSRHEIVGEHPDTGHSLQGLVIPHWETLLDIAARCHELAGLGYLGVDLVLDQDRGPLLLELNARPGLAIQIANAAGLMHRVKLVEAHILELPTIQDRIAFARQHFGLSQPPAP